MFGGPEGFFLFVFLLLLALAFPVLIWQTAKSKRRSRILWTIICLYCPVLYLVLLALGPLPEEDPRPKKPCPYCAEMILCDASVCRYCGGKL